MDNLVDLAMEVTPLKSTNMPTIWVLFTVHVSNTLHITSKRLMVQLMNAEIVHHLLQLLEKMALADVAL
jgi:hypothetical protein